jgi:tetratricopeptide (TPR) repeat protein
MRPALGAAAAFAAIALAAQGPMRARFPRLPSLSELPSTPYALQDASFAAAGMRAAAADLAWMQVLQYSAGGVPELPDPRDKPFAHLLPLTQRVVRLDPSFHRAYLYGAGILAWFRAVSRPDEAASILAEGLRRDPGQPLYSLYLAAIAFKRQGDTGRMIALLESTFEDPATPSQMRTILANIHKARGDYARALFLWQRILDEPRDASEHARAVLQIREIRDTLKNKRQRR